MVVRLSTIKMVTEALSTEEILQITAAQELPVIWFTGFDITLPELHQLTALLLPFSPPRNGFVAMHQNLTHGRSAIAGG